MADDSGGFWGPVISGVTSLWGGQDAQGFNSSQASKQREWEERMYKNRYQYATADLQAAGLNPMLAYTQGVAGSVPSGASASSPSSTGGYAEAAQSVMAARMNSAQVANVNADTANKEASADLIAGQAAQAWSTAYMNGVNSDLIRSTTDKVKAEIPKINAEVENLADQGKVLRRTAELLIEQANTSYQQGMTEVQKRELMRAQINKLVNETKLSEFDIDAANNRINVRLISMRLNS